jgi:hypothetical protein
MNQLLAKDVKAFPFFFAENSVEFTANKYSNCVAFKCLLESISDSSFQWECFASHSNARARDIHHQTTTITKKRSHQKGMKNCRLKETSKLMNRLGT